MTIPTTETNGTQHHRARGNGTNASQLGSRKVYVPGSTPEMRIPMREVTLSPTRTPTGQMESNPPLRLYDTSGPYTDPTFTPDLRQGCHHCDSGGFWGMVTARSWPNPPRHIVSSVRLTRRWTRSVSRRPGSRGGPGLAGVSPRCTTRDMARLPPRWSSSPFAKTSRQNMYATR